MNLDFKVDQGSTFQKKIVMKSKDANGLLVVDSPNGLLFRMHVREKFDSATTIQELTIANNKIILFNGPNPEDKYIVLKIPAAETAVIVPKVYVYDLECEDSAGVVKKILKGKFSVYAEVTR